MAIHDHIDALKATAAALRKESLYFGLTIFQIITRYHMMKKYIAFNPITIRPFSMNGIVSQAHSIMNLIKSFKILF